MAPASALLCPVHGHVGVAQQRLGSVVVGGGERDPGADGEEMLAAVQAHRAVDRCGKALGDLGHAARPVGVGADDDELVPAESRDRVGRAHSGRQPGRQGGQDRVAGGVTERVVDDLEAVEIEHQDRHVDAFTPATGQRVGETVERQRAVRQAGERVVQRGVSSRLFLGVALDGDDDQRRDRGQELDLVLGEPARLVCMDVQDPERPVLALDRDAEAADHAELEHRRRRG